MHGETVKFNMGQVLQGPYLLSVLPLPLPILPR